jgi:hypothetical protein
MPDRWFAMMFLAALLTFVAATLTMLDASTASSPSAAAIGLRSGQSCLTFPEHGDLFPPGSSSKRNEGNAAFYPPGAAAPDSCLVLRELNGHPEAP